MPNVIQHLIPKHFPDPCTDVMFRAKLTLKTGDFDV